MAECSLCGHFEPREFCWLGSRLDCPFEMPPHHLSMRDLWAHLVAMNKRITAREGGEK